MVTVVMMRAQAQHPLQVRPAAVEPVVEVGKRPGPRYNGSIGEEIDHDFFTIDRNRGPGP